MQMKILIIKRDNIGDLLCTTPLISAIRSKFPSAYIAALVNSYNRPAIEENPDIDEIFSFTKAKHKAKNESTFSIHLKRLRMLLNLRAKRFDHIFICNLKPDKALSLAAFLGGKNVVAYQTDSFWSFLIKSPISSTYTQGKHEVENLFNLSAALGIPSAPIPKMVLAPNQSLRKKITTSIPAKNNIKKIAIHISARKEKQRWSEASFALLIKKIHKAFGYQFLLFWSPGDENNPFHPGDDQKADRLLSMVSEIPIFPVVTNELSELIAGLSLCDLMVCSDGGGMHIGAALGLPILCFFGNSDPCTWHPWGVPHQLLQSESMDVKDISAEEAWCCFQKLHESFRDSQATV